MPAPKQTKVKFPRAKATKIIKKVEKHLKPFVDRQMACGSYRRGAQMIGDIDFVVIPKEGVTLPQMLPPNEGINWVGDNKAQVVIDGEKVDFKVTTPEAWGATILYFTGPADFNIKYRWMAKKRGMKLNEYGLFDRNTDAYIAGATEQDIYDALKRPFRDPDQRTGWKRAESNYIDYDNWHEDRETMNEEKWKLYKQQGGKTPITNKTSKRDRKLLNDTMEKLGIDYEPKKYVIDNPTMAYRAMPFTDYAKALEIGYLYPPKQGIFASLNPTPTKAQASWKGYPVFEIDITGLTVTFKSKQGDEQGRIITIDEPISVDRILHYGKNSYEEWEAEILLHPYGPGDDYIDLLEEFPNAKNFDALISNPWLYHQLKKGVTVLNSMEELLAQDFHPTDGQPLYYVNFPLTVYRGVTTRGGGKRWTWKRWLDGNKMGASFNMGVHDSQPATLNMQEALNYAEANRFGRHDPDFELYAIDIQDYFVNFPRPSQDYLHKDCNPVVEWTGDVRDNVWIDGSLKRKYRYVSCDNKNHSLTVTPVIFILGGALYEDMQVIWDADVNASYFEAPYQPNQELSDYTPQSLMTSSAITGDYTVDSLKYGQTTLSSETTKFNFITGKEYTFDELPDDNAGRSSLREDAIHHFRSKKDGGYGFSGSHLNATYRAVIIPNKELVQRFGHLRGKSELQKNIEEHGLDYPSIGNEGNNRRIAMAKLGRDMPHLEIISAETFGSENQWIVDNLTLLLTQRARTLSELIDDLGIRGITVESNLVRLPNFVRVGKHVPAVWGLAGQDYNRKHPYNAISPAAGRKQHLKTMFEKLDPRELDWDDDVTWNQKNEPDWSDEVSWDAEGSTSRCPICFGFIPNNANPSAYPGALSRYDNATEICSACGQAEGMSGLFLGSVDKDKLADMETITDPWLRHTYLINLVKDVMPAAFRGE